MKNPGVKSALVGIAVGTLLFVGFPFLEALSPVASAVYFGAFVFCYAVMPLGGLVYDLRSGDFEKREGYSP